MATRTFGAATRGVRASHDAARTPARARDARAMRASVVGANAPRARATPARARCARENRARERPRAGFARARIGDGRRDVRARSEFEERKGRGKGFVGGLLVGGAVFGALGFLFAPQLSKTLLGGKRALNKALDDESEDELEVTRQNLNDKIAALNAAIDNFSDQAESGVEKNVKKLNEELNGLAETGAGSKPKTSEA